MPLLYSNYSGAIQALPLPHYGAGEAVFETSSLLFQNLLGGNPFAKTGIPFTVGLCSKWI